MFRAFRRLLSASCSCLTSAPVLCGVVRNRSRGSAISGPFAITSRRAGAIKAGAGTGVACDRALTRGAREARRSFARRRLHQVVPAAAVGAAPAIRLGRGEPLELRAPVHEPVLGRARVAQVGAVEILPPAV